MGDGGKEKDPGTGNGTRPGVGGTGYLVFGEVDHRLQSTLYLTRGLSILPGTNVGPLVWPVCWEDYFSALSDGDGRK
jgi:hypothetical protein